MFVGPDVHIRNQRRKDEIVQPQTQIVSPTLYRTRPPSGRGLAASGYLFYGELDVEKGKPCWYFSATDAGSWPCEEEWMRGGTRKKVEVLFFPPPRFCSSCWETRWKFASKDRLTLVRMEELWGPLFNASTVFSSEVVPASVPLYLVSNVPD